MYSELKQILVMSNSELTLIKGDVQDGEEFDILKSAYGVTAASSSNDHQEISVKDDDDDDDTKQDWCHSAVHSDEDHKKKPRLLLGGLNATDHEDDEGFKTPTYDNQIPAAATEIKQCPPAPRKPKPPLASIKRKSSSSSSSSTSLRLDLSQEVNSLFPKPILDDLHRKIKKARRNN